MKAKIEFWFLTLEKVFPNNRNITLEIEQLH